MEQTNAFLDALDILITKLRIPIEHRDALISLVQSVDDQAELIEYVKGDQLSFAMLPAFMSDILQKNAAYFQEIAAMDLYEREEGKACIGTAGFDGAGKSALRFAATPSQLFQREKKHAEGDLENSRTAIYEYLYMDRENPDDTAKPTNR